MSKPVLIVVTADSHTPSYSGLVHPDGVALPDGGSSSLTNGQRWLWHTFDEFTKAAQRAASGRLVYLAHLGDSVHGRPKDTMEIATPDMSAQCAAAIHVLTPLLEIADYAFWHEGTEAHDGQNGQYAEQIARELHGAGYPIVPCRTEHGRERYCWKEADWRAGGVLLNTAHHPPGGDPTNAARKLADRLKTEYRDEHREPPALVLRAHAHRVGDSDKTVKFTRCIIVPAWCLRDRYAYRIAARPADVGGVLIAAHDGHIEDIDIWTRTPPKSAPWEAPDETKRKRSARRRCAIHE